MQAKQRTRTKPNSHDLGEMHSLCGSSTLQVAAKWARSPVGSNGSKLSKKSSTGKSVIEGIATDSTDDESRRTRKSRLESSGSKSDVIAQPVTASRRHVMP